MKRKRKKKKGRRRGKRRKIDFSLGNIPSMSLFRNFYKSQNLVEDYDHFFQKLEKPLPITFRINSTLHPQIIDSMRRKILNLFSDQIRNAKIDYNQFIIETNNKRIKHLEANDPENVELAQLKEKNLFTSKLPPLYLKPPRILEWYPGQVAFQLDCSKKMLSKHPALNEFRQWLIFQTEKGLISRQEAVSMIPPLLFNYDANSRILDTCAAPGSKTAQLLEFVANCQRESKEKLPGGFVMANDLNSSRCHTLVHQQLRLKSLCRNLMVCNHDATKFPNLIQKTRGAGETSTQLYFDNVLCDVVCSGDGTMRKQPDVWLKWRTDGGWVFHNQQIAIAKRGYQLLRPGGLLVYSTCSMNPVEDEAVVAELLRQCPDLEIVDVRNDSNKLRGLISSEGLQYWKIHSKKGEDIGAFVDGKYPGLRASFFPPTAEELKRMNLTRCIRVLPHQNDSGGFFITLFRKRPREGERMDLYIPKQILECDLGKLREDETPGRRRYSQVYLNLPRENMKQICEEYGMDEEVGSCLFSHLDLDSRKGQKEWRRKLIGGSQQFSENEVGKFIFFGNKMVKKITEINHVCRRITFVTAGVKAFEVMEDWDSRKTEKESGEKKKYRYRLTQSGADILNSFFKKPGKVISVKRQTFVVLLLSERIEKKKLERRIGDKEDLKNLMESQNGSIIVKTDGDVMLLMSSSRRVLVRTITPERLIKIKIRMNVEI